MSQRATVALAVAPDLPFEFRDVDVEGPRADEVLVKITATGICHTDIASKEQSFPVPLPMVLGHEGAGVVEEVGSAVSHLRPGDHVVLCGDSCGHCSSCQRGMPFYCDEFAARNLTGERTDGSTCLSCEGEPVRGRFVSQSSFSTRVLAAGRGAIKIPEEAPLELMGPLGCGMTTGVGTVVNALKPHPGSKIAIFGAGTVGIAAAMGAQLSGCEQIIVVDLHQNRLDMASQLGATRVINAGQEDAVEVILELTRGGADFSVESTGAPSVVEQAVACLRTPGWCAQVGVTPAETKVPLDMDLVMFGRGIRGVVMGEANVQQFVPYLAQLYLDGRLPFDKFVKFYDFKDIDQAIHDSAVTGEVIKPILRMPS